jgi:hypothetical protein
MLAMSFAAALCSKSLRVAGLTALVVAVAPAAQAAQVTFNLAGGTGTNLSSYSYTNSGVGLTISTAQAASTTPTSPQAFVSYTSPGVCLFARADSQTRCGVATGGTYNNLAFSFTTDVLLSSFNVSQAIPTASGAATFGLDVLAGGSTIGSSAAIVGNGTGINRVNFTSPILVKANTPVVFNASSSVLNSSFRINDLIVDTVPPVDAPGPLPMLGAAAAFRASRRLRRRMASKKAATA